MATSNPNDVTTSLSVPAAIQVEAITKLFPGVVANREVSLTVRRGSFHAVIGENGAGKSTLLNILYGLYRPDRGRIVIGGEDVSARLNSPADSIRRGLGMVSQHYALISGLSVMENIVLGAEPAGPLGIMNRAAAQERVRSVMRQLKLDDLDLNQRAERVSVAVGQKIEIVKALTRGAKTLLLDEPTATLAPQEADTLFALLGTLIATGTTVVFVTHKLREVMAYSQFVTVLRAGQNVGDFDTTRTTPGELLSHMIGRRSGLSPLNEPNDHDSQLDTALNGGRIGVAPTDLRLCDLSAPDRTLVHASASPADITAHGGGYEPRPLLAVRNLHVASERGGLSVNGVSLEVRGGEIVGVAGVDGSGQKELVEAIVGIRHPTTGTMTMHYGPERPGISLNGKSVRQRQRLGIGYIPEDRQRTALALDFSVAENYLLGHETDRAWGGGPLLHSALMTARANAMIDAYDVRLGTRDSRLTTRTLSGGNQQKVVIARALDGSPRLLIACQPTRGLDVEASRFVYRTINRARDRGVGVLVTSLDLDEILQVSDRIIVMFNGQVAGVVPRAEANAEGIGALMTGSAALRPDPPVSAGAGA